MSQRALEHLDEAEVTLLSYMRRISEFDPEEEEEEPDLGNVLMAVLRHVSRAAGIIEGEQHERESDQLHTGG